MTRNLIKKSFNELFEQKQLPSPSARNRMLQYQREPRKKKLTIMPTLVTILLFVGIGISLLFLNQSNINSNPLTHEFEIPFSFSDGKYFLYDITIGDAKSKVKERIGTDYVEDTNLEIGGLGYSSRLKYENLNLTILFSEEQVVSITKENLNEEDIEQLFNADIGNTFFYEESADKYNESNAKHIYSEETLQIITAKYDPYRNLWLTISSTSPEFINNLKNGIYE